MNNFKISPRRLLGLVIIIVMFCFCSSVGAQFFPYAPPPIRTAPFLGYPGSFPLPFMPPVLAPPPPIVRSANATISLWYTAGTGTSLLIYNPTTLIGIPAPSVSPSPLLSTLAGLLITSELISSNPILFNYLANSYLLPTGLAFYAIP
ncbi:MAG: hypothetical protein ACMUIP_03695 [bacterium]